MYRTSTPVTAGNFFDRRQEIDRLEEAIRHLKADSPNWLAIIGPRKVGKTSLILELTRRASDLATNSEPEVVFIVMDCFEELPLMPEIFRRYALRTVDAALGAELSSSLEMLAGRPSDLRAELLGSQRFNSLPQVLRQEILELGEGEIDSARLRLWLDLPERLAEALNLRMLVTWDEFQELAVPMSRSGKEDLLPLLRSHWQRHQRTSYVISGSAPTLLTELVTAEHSPFFQHFSLLHLGPLPRAEAVRLIIDNAPAHCPVSEHTADRIVDVVGGHPFYLQLIGEALTRQPTQDTDAGLKEVFQELLFSRTGRLALYFDREFQRLVGRSGYLARTLESLSGGARRLSEIASEIGTASGSTVRYLQRLEDAVVRTENGDYQLADPVFGLWLAWRRPGGTVVPMQVIGDEAEQRVARRLARMGFDLIYQSRASRGAFDLLATRGHHQLGIQVKRSPLPLRFELEAWHRMEAEGERFGWRWVVAAVLPPPAEQVILLDPGTARIKKRATLNAGAEIPNLLAWIDR